MPWLFASAEPPGGPAALPGEIPSYISTGLQTASTILVAILLSLLIRVINRRYVGYWAAAWVGLACGLVAVNLSFQYPEWTRLLLSAYWVAGDLFGFLLYIGCRDYAQERPLARRDLWLFVPPVAIGVILPGYFDSIESLFPAHALFFGGYCLLALAATLPHRPDDRQTLIGLRLLQIALVALVTLFWHYSIVLGWPIIRHGIVVPQGGYLQYSSLYDAFCEIALAFAQVVLGTDTVRRELAAANRQLAAASEQLALAARTDVLTGLLNRRAFESMLADPSAAPAPGAIAVLDINDLKPLNDRHGHTAGDSALRAVARALQQRTRIGDPVFRLGGDEFLVLLPGVPAAEMTRRLEDLDKSLLSTRLPGIPTPVDITVAWGVSEYRDRPDLPLAVDRSDSAMYECKQRRKTAAQAQVG